MEFQTKPLADGFAKFALEQSLKDQVPEMVIVAASHDPKVGINDVPNVCNNDYEVPTPPTTHGDSLLLGRDDLPKSNSAVDTIEHDPKPPGTHLLSGADRLTDKVEEPATDKVEEPATDKVEEPAAKKVEEHAAANGTSFLPLAGSMDKAATPPAPVNGHIEDIPTSPATRLKRRLEETKDLIVCPGVYDGFSARIAMLVGCDAMYMVLEPPNTAERQAEYYSDWCRNHRFSARHGRFRFGHTQ